MSNTNINVLASFDGEIVTLLTNTVQNHALCKLDPL